MEGEPKKPIIRSVPNYRRSKVRDKIQQLLNYCIANPGTNVTILCETHNVNRYYFYQTIRKLPNYEEYIAMKERMAELRNKTKDLKEE
ncbi:MAG: hypothetical protein RLY98_1475 [Bacteroidota bacterium]|jgi:hypothetical protein